MFSINVMSTLHTIVNMIERTYVSSKEINKHAVLVTIAKSREVFGIVFICVSL
jgi:hypothetical protein